MIKEVKEYFDIGEEPHAKFALIDQMRRTYRNWHYRLRMHFEKFDNEEDAMQNCPHGVTQEEWKNCIERFKSEAFKQRSTTNKHNRGVERTNHCSGTKSFARLIHENYTNQEDPEAEVALDRFDLWYLTHFNAAKNKWVDEKSRRTYEQLIAIRDADEETNELSVDEIFDMVLPPKSGYIRGMGVGPKPTSTKSKIYSAHLERELEASRKREEDARAREDEARAREAEVLKLNAALQARMAEIERDIAMHNAALDARFESIEKAAGLSTRWDNTMQDD